ncbi:MAG: MFS transporter [Chloroflexota bacterium]|nr:MFS transporter [Chloroflexota bacterium]
MQFSARLARRTPFFYGWAVVFAAGASMFARNAAASLTLAVFMYPMSQELGWHRSLIAGAASVGGLIASGVSPVVGWVTDRYGPRVVIFVSILVLGLSTMSLSWAVVPVAFYIAYATGRVIFASNIQIGASVAVSNWFVRRRGRATGLLFFSHSLGMGIFPLMAQLLIGARGWQGAWFWLGVVVWAVALAPVWFLMVHRPEQVGLKPDGLSEAKGQASPNTRSAAEVRAWTLREAVRTPALWLLALTGGLLFLVQAGINTHQGAYLRDQGFSGTVAAFTLTVLAFGAGAGSLLWGQLVDRAPVRFLYTAVAVLLGVVAALFITVHSVWQAFLLSALFGIGIGGILVLPAVAYADYFGRRSLGAIRGVTEPFVSIGQAVGALLAGIVFDVTGSYGAAFYTFLGAALVAGALILLAPPPRANHT